MRIRGAGIGFVAARSAPIGMPLGGCWSAVEGFGDVAATRVAGAGVEGVWESPAGRCEGVLNGDVTGQISC